MSFCTWSCGTLVGTELEAAHESELLVADAETAVGLTVDEGMVLNAQAAFPLPVLRVGYRVPLLVLQPHQVAGSKVATPRLEPAEQESLAADEDDGELDELDDGELAVVMVERVDGAPVVVVVALEDGGLVEDARELDEGAEAPVDGGREMPVTDTEVG